jgi:hypothetical protein
VTTTSPAGEDAGAVVVVEAVDDGADDGRGVPGRGEPPAGTEDGTVVLVVGGAGWVVAVVEVEVVVPELSESESESSESAGTVVDVVGGGSVVVVVVDVGSVVGVVLSVVVVVPSPGSGSPMSATAGAAGRQATATKNVDRARARRTRINTRISSPGVRGRPPEWQRLERNRYRAHRAQRSFVTEGNVPKR